MYQNEPIYLTYTLYTRASATFKGFEEEPSTTGFWVEDFPPRGLSGRYEQNIGGHRYVVADVRSMALFPTEAGNFELDPGTLKVEIELRQRDPFNSFFSRDIFGRKRYNVARPSVVEIEPRLLKTEKIPIKVKPLPTFGKPDSFTGAVGQYTISASLDTSSVEEGQAVTYRLRLAGEGNLNTVQLPTLPLMDHFKYYDSSSSLDLRKDRQIVEGEKIVESVLLPKKAGVYTIPSLEFSYFDPKQEKYITLKTPSLPLSVKGVKREELPLNIFEEEDALPKDDVEILGEDIRYIAITPGTWQGIEKPLFLEKRYWIGLAVALGVPFILLLIGFIFERRNQDVKGMRGRRSHKLARKKLKSAKACLKEGKEQQFYDALSKSIHGYFADKLNVEVGGIRVQVVQEKLEGKLDEDELENIKNLFRDIDYGRFSAAKVKLADMKETYNEADRVITFVERKRI